MFESSNRDLENVIRDDNFSMQSLSQKGVVPSNKNGEAPFYARDSIDSKQNQSHDKPSRHIISQSFDYMRRSSRDAVQTQKTSEKNANAKNGKASRGSNK